jgi:cell wall-associated NlpC family hydrolase
VSGTRRRRWGAAAAALTVSVALVSGSLAGPALGVGGRHHNPSGTAIARSKHTVTVRQRQVAAAAGRLGQAERRLHALSVSAEIAVEAYDGARVKLATARRAVHSARLVLARANDDVTKGQRQATRFATAAYETGGLNAMTAYLQPGGPADLVSRVGAIQAISTSVHITVQRLTAAQIYQGVVSRQAEAAEAKAASAAQAAARAKASAVAAVHRQGAVLAGLRREQARLRTLLAGARSTESRLEREHLAALARARRRAAARTQVQSGPSGSPFAGTSGSTAGTVSAGTAAAALQQAESQIGKPYQWGAAGPDRYDCSGLVMWSYLQVGVHMDHWTGDQWNEGAHVSQSELRPGDLVFFAYDTSDPSTIHHVGMYLGNSQMVDAPFTGADVRYDYAFRSDYIGAVRPYQR